MPGLQNTGAISLDDLQNEFGNTNPIEMSEYYRGLEVPDALENVGVPLSGVLSLSDFYGAVDITYSTSFSPSGTPEVSSSTPMQQEFVGTPGTGALQTSFTVPDYVNEVAVCVVGGGGGGGHSRAYSSGNEYSAGGGAGGGLAWKNNIVVVPGSSHTAYVGGGGGGAIRNRLSAGMTNGGGGQSSNTSLTSTPTAGGGSGGRLYGTANGGTHSNADGGGTGGPGFRSNSYHGGGGGGAGGYNGSGGAAGSSNGSPGAGGGGGGGSSGYNINNITTAYGGNGGSVGTHGQGVSGSGGSGSGNFGGSGGTGSPATNQGGFGGSGVMSSYYAWGGSGRSGGNGAARVIYTGFNNPDITTGAGRSYPSNAANVTHDFTVDRYDEGTAITVTITTTSVVDNTVLYWEIVRTIGSANAPAIREDMSAFTGTATIISNSGTINFTITDDYTIDGLTEQYEINLRVTSAAGPIVHTSVPFRVGDTSVPTYVLSQSGGAQDILEGQSFTIDLDALGTLDGTSIYYTITGVTSADLNGESLSGSFLVNSETASKTFTVTFDNISTDPFIENETFTLSLDNGEDSIDVIILDVSYDLSITSSHTTQVAEDELFTNSGNNQTFTVPAGVSYVSALLIGGGGGGSYGRMSAGSGGGGGGGGVLWINNIPVVQGDVIKTNVGAGGAGGYIAGNSPFQTYNGASLPQPAYISQFGLTTNTPLSGGSTQLYKNNVLIGTATGGAGATDNGGAGAGGYFTVASAYEDLQWSGSNGFAGNAQLSSTQAGGGGGAAGFRQGLGGGGKGGYGRSERYISNQGYNYDKVANGGGGGGVGYYTRGSSGTNGTNAPQLYVSGSGTGGNLQINYSGATGGTGGSGGPTGVSAGEGAAQGGGGGGGAGGTMALQTIYYGGFPYGYGLFAKSSGEDGGKGTSRIIYGKGRVYPDASGAGPSVNDIIIDEGETVTFTVNTTNVPDNTVLDWAVSPSSNNTLGAISDFATTSGTVTITSNTGSFTLPNNNDKYPEGGESYHVDISDQTSPYQIYSTSANLYYVDSSSTALDITSSATGLISAGGYDYYAIIGNTLTITFTDSAGELSDGFSVPWSVTGITAADLTSGSVQGSSSLSSGTASITFQFNNNAQGKTMRIQSDLGTNEGTDSVFYPRYFALSTQTSSIIETSGIVSAFENQALEYTFSAQGFILGNQIPVKIDSTNGGNAADFTGAIAPNGTYNYPHFLMNVSGGWTGYTGSFTTSLVDDTYGEGDEDITLTPIGANSTASLTIKEDTYNLSASSSTVNEGQSITWTLQTQGVTAGTSLPYTITGIDNNDITSGSLTGNFTVAAPVGDTSTQTISITLANDLTLEGTETATLTLNNAPGPSESVTINDTSVPTYDLSVNLTQMYEGQTATFTLDTTGISNGTNIGYTITNIQSADITSSLTGNFYIMNNTASINVTASDTDALLEANETMTLTLDNGLAPTDPQVTILASTYSLSKSHTVIDEGQTIQYTLHTQGVADGTLIPYTGTGISSSDLSAGSLTGNFIVGDANYNTSTRIGISTILMTFDNDLTTEGSESLQVCLDNGLSCAGPVSITDTSIKPHIGMLGSSYTINETSNTTVTFIANQSINNYDIYYYVEPLAGYAFPDLAEFESPTLTQINSSKYRGIITFSGTSATQVWKMTADTTTETAEGFKITFDTQFTNGIATDRDTNDVMYVTDTSFDPAYSWSFFQSSSWTVPAGVTEFHASLIGSGGQGANSFSANGGSWNKGGGGGGGGSLRYTTSPIACTPGETLTITVDGTSSRIMRGATTLIYALSGGDGSGATGGAGGSGGGGGTGVSRSGGGGGDNYWQYGGNNSIGGGGGGAAGWNQSGGPGATYYNNTSAANATYNYGAAGGGGAMSFVNFNNDYIIHVGAGGWGGGQRIDYSKSGTFEQGSTTGQSSLHTRQGDGHTLWGSGTNYAYAVKGSRVLYNTINYTQESLSHSANSMRWIGAGGGGGGPTPSGNTYIGKDMYLNDSVSINWPNLNNYPGTFEIDGKPGGYGAVRITIGGPGSGGDHPANRGYNQTWWTG